MRERLLFTLANAGVPVDGTIGTVDSTHVELIFMEGATQAQRDLAATIVANFNWSEAAHNIWLRDQRRDQARQLFEQTDISPIVMRALVVVLVNEINTLRTWLRDFKTQVAASATLADLKTRVATLTTTNDRTLVQARNAMFDSINTGQADS